MSEAIYNCLVIAQEPLVLCQNMDSYFKNTPPDCSLYSEGNHEISIHKELLYQTRYMREMIMNTGFESKIEVFCPSISKEELKNIVDFLYCGKISCKNQSAVSETTENLNELFGFELTKDAMSETKEIIVLPIKKKIPRKKPLRPKTNHKLERDLENLKDFLTEESIEIDDESETDPKDVKIKKKKNSSKKKILKENGMYVCSQCGKKFQTRIGFKKHVNERCGKEKFLCPDCKEVFNTSAKKFQHIAAFHPLRKIKNCPMCESKFLSMAAMINHVKKRHPEQKSDLHQYLPPQYAKASGKMCPQCNETFESRTKMFEHYLFVHPEAPIYHCSICGERYITLSGLNSHVFKVHERKLSDQRCTFCGKDFENKENVKDHVASEHQDKKYHCSMCDASYLAQHSLQKHIDSVHEGKRYQCTECGEVFETVARLENHIVTKHDRDKLFQCPKCPNVYVKKKALDDHIAFLHDKAAGHLCPECGESFQEKRRMKEHILTVHQSMRFACKICGKTYASSLSLRNHVRLNHEGKKPPPEKCPQCEKIFKGIGTLKRHIGDVHEKKRPHACHLCGLSFSQSGNLKNHLKGKHKHVI